MARILIVHHKWDADFADPLSAHLRRCGHSPVAHVAGERLLPRSEDDSTALVLVWSGALAVDETALQQAAMLSMRQRSLLVRVDDTEPPPDIIDSAAVVAVSSYHGLETHEAVVRALALSGKGHSSRSRPRLHSWLPSFAAWRLGLTSGRLGLPQPVLTRGHALGAALAVGALIIMAGGLGMALRDDPEGPGLAVAETTGSDGLRPRLIAPHEAQLLTRTLAGSEDPIELRAALLALGGVPEAHALQARLATLEDAAWREAAATPDAGARLLAIEAFRATFPGSRRLARIVDRAVREARDHIVSAQQALSALGLEPGPANGVMTPQTEAAVRAFQAGKGLTPTGVIDPRLLSALEAAMPAPLQSGTARLQGVGSESGQPTSASARSSAPPSYGAARLSAGASAEGAPTALGRPSPPAALSLIQDCPQCPMLVVLPQGRGQVGDPGSAGDPTERPARTVTLDYGLAMGRFEVTIGEWNACVSDGGCHRGRRITDANHDQAPVVDVSFDDAKLYLAWLQRRTGHGYRLPSEAEWEYAARAGAITALASDISSNLCAFGNVADGASGFPDRDETCRDGFPAERAPAGQFRPNAFGLYDMIGNVWEWTEDCWHGSYRGAPVSPAPWLRACETQERVLRGGSYMTGPRQNRLSRRLPVQGDLRLEDAGFRVVRPVAD
jgi:formylglycine-generating enzyme required for sulfatase activity